MDQVIEKVESLELKDEVIHFGRLGIFWGNSLKNPTMQLPITSTCSRCLSTATSPFATQKTFDKIGQMLKKIIKETHNDILDKIKETAAFLKDKGIQAPEFGLILGSGLGELAEEIENPVVVDYADIPNWGRSTVVGQAGKLVYGELAGRKVLALQGRFHFYEGNPLEVVTFPVRNESTRM